MRLQVPADHANAAFTKKLKDEVDKLVSDEGGSDELDAKVTGMPAFIMAAQDGVKKDIEEMDTISFPLALLIFIIMLRSIRLLILPILNIGVVVSAAFALMYPIALHVDVGSTVPTLMLSVSIAMSIDYSLFLLSRFREEIECGVHHKSGREDDGCGRAYRPHLGHYISPMLCGNHLPALADAANNGHRCGSDGGSIRHRQPYINTDNATNLPKILQRSRVQWPRMHRQTVYFWSRQQSIVDDS